MRFMPVTRALRPKNQGPSSPSSWRLSDGPIVLGQKRSGNQRQRSKSAVLCRHRRPKGATMLADLDLLLTAVFATADDLLPDRRKNAKRSVTDAEVGTLAVAQAIMDIASDREFLAVAW